MLPHAAGVRVPQPQCYNVRRMPLATTVLINENYTGPVHLELITLGPEGITTTLPQLSNVCACIIVLHFTKIV